METMVRTEGGELWADDTGGDGLPLVLLHPGIADSRIWDGIAPSFAERSRVIRYDSRGYGRSPAPTTKYSLAADLRAVLDHFEVPRAVLAGSSMGGATAISLALDDPPAYPRLGELAVPCTLLLGERDMPRTVRCNEDMAAAIPGCRLVRRADCDHLLTLRAPDAVRDLVLELYARVG